jgi:hypothetical protein
MKSYCFADYSASSDIIVLEVKPCLGYYPLFYDGFSALQYYVSVKIWWPDHGNSEIDARRALEEAVLPALTTPYPNSMRSRDLNYLSEETFKTYCEMNGRNSEIPIVAWSSITEDEISEHGGDRLKALAKRQGIAFQDLRINEMIVDGLGRVFPDRKRPWGIYLEHWQDPSYWTFK